MPRGRSNPSDFEPMLAQLAEPPLQDSSLVYEPKYDGVRIVARVGSGTTLTSRLGNDKTPQFTEVAEALTRWHKKLKVPVVVDGEVVALNAKGQPVSFQNLQGRIHLGRGYGRRPMPIDPNAPKVPIAYFLFDLLAEDSKDLRGRPLTERRARLEQLFAKRPDADKGLLRLSEQVHGDGHALYERMQKEHGEGLIAKRAASPYHSGRRTPDWRKLKIVQEQEFVIGGWTDPRGSRTHFGALLLGVASPQSPAPSPQPLIYVGSVGTGFNDRELTRVMNLLKGLETPTSPFVEEPDVVERARWVKPSLIAQVRFTEWTTDNKLRHPVYLGLRDDKRPRDVVRETAATSHDGGSNRLRQGYGGPPKLRAKAERTRPTDYSALIEQLQALEDARRDGTLDLPDGTRLAVTNLHKVFWPKLRLTKGDLFRYYVKVADVVLPAVADRPLVMKRFPNGIDAPPFYQHQVEKTPSGIRVEPVGNDDRPQLIGGSLTTLLYMTQLASISQDPWFSRVPDTGAADCAAIDLDPPEGASFAQVLEVALWVRDELVRIGATGVAKTSGASGLHIYVRLPRGTPFDAGQIFCQIVATLVAARHPKHATTERSVRARGKRIYLDCLQNAAGKTLATAYSARASEYAGVSTPLSWSEIEAGVDREDFTITSVPERLKKVGDLWAALREAPAVDLQRAARLATSGQKPGQKPKSTPKRA